jgi:hypothetical protein
MGSAYTCMLVSCGWCHSRSGAGAALAAALLHLRASLGIDVHQVIGCNANRLFSIGRQ